MNRETYQAVMKAQNGKCACCLGHEYEIMVDGHLIPYGRTLAADYDPKTGSLIGLLCKTCRGIIRVKLTVEIAESCVAREQLKVDKWKRITAYLQRRS